MLTTREIVFIDPAVADISGLIAGLRPEVVPVLLSGAMPTAEEIAQSLRSRHGLDAIHIVVHGRSGELSFSAGALSLANINQVSGHLAAIGDALGLDGDLRLWSCHTGEGARGRAFVRALSHAIGTPVAAATGRVGAAGLGGEWVLKAHSDAGLFASPLTQPGIASYTGTLATSGTITATGTPITIYGTFSGTHRRRRIFYCRRHQRHGGGCRLLCSGHSRRYDGPDDISADWGRVWQRKQYLHLDWRRGPQFCWSDWRFYWNARHGGQRG